MNDSRSARSDMLQRIRSANAGETRLHAANADWTGIDRGYESGHGLPREALLALLMERLRDYDAEVERISAVEVAVTIAKLLQARGNPRMLIADGFSTSLLPRQNGFEADPRGAPAGLDRFEGILTEATLGIALTGTIVLQNVPGQGSRAATLVPDFHLCVLSATTVVESVPEAIRWLARSPALPTTFISGPSATADIEMTRIKGVHGPRFLHVLIVEDER